MDKLRKDEERKTQEQKAKAQEERDAVGLHEGQKFKLMSSPKTKKKNKDQGPKESEDKALTPEVSIELEDSPEVSEKGDIFHQNRNIDY